ncbi:MAG TPA: S8 family peptidase [Pyrinomonadaceae bacterium]|nr:S8 family peptidase [Pyrinomonadaceae bacterium]
MSTIGRATAVEPSPYSREFSSVKTSHSAQSLTPQVKLKKVRNAIPNRYVVVLNDDVVPSNASFGVRRAKVSAIANAMARAHGGKIRFVYQTALNGFSIELPNEAAALAISQNPQVKFVEQCAVGTVVDVQPNPPWGLDRIDESGIDGQYIYNATGSGVTAYVLDTGIRSTHVDFGGRASVAADFVNESGCTGANNDCMFVGHGTHVAGIVGSNTYGVAKAITLRSVKVCDSNGFCDSDVVAAAIDWLTQDHINSGNLAVVNISLRFFERITNLDDAVVNSTNQGVTIVVAAGNESGQNVENFSPAGVLEAITVGSSDINDMRSSFSNIGQTLDLFAPGSDIVSLINTDDFGTRTLSGTSMASPHVAGAVGLYLQGRSSITNCGAHPIQGPSTPLGGAISTCADRVARFMDSNTRLSVLGDVPSGTPNRLLYIGSLPAPANPIDNQRFFVWQHYADFGFGDPDEGGLNFWTGNITGTCGTGFNDNNGCTHTKRIDVSRAFWVAAYGWLFTPSYGTTDNYTFLHLCYEIYLRRSVSDGDGGFQFWLNDLNGYGNPANQDGVNHLIDAFLSSTEYRERFGQG